MNEKNTCLDAIRNADKKREWRTCFSRTFTFNNSKKNKDNYEKQSNAPSSVDCSFWIRCARTEQHRKRLNSPPAFVASISSSMEVTGPHLQHEMRSINLMKV